MRRVWRCPDLGPPPDDDRYLVVRGSKEEWPHCPAYSLRTAAMGMPAEHLIDDAIHPATIVADRAAELENGAISADRLAPKVLELAHDWLRERAARMEYQSQERRKAK